MRRRADGATAWLVTRHADQAALLRDPRLSADNRLPNYPDVSPSLGATLSENRTFITMDDPAHQKDLARHTHAFSVKRLRGLRPQIEKVIADLLDGMEQTGPPADLVTDFALPLASKVICELLGVPYSDHAFFQRATAVLLNNTVSAEEGSAASKQLVDYLIDAVTAKLADPAEDLLSDLATRYLAHGLITPEECGKQVRLLLVSGHESTAHMVSLGVLALLEHPDQVAAVRDGGQEVVTRAVEELLRYLTVVQMGRRRVAVEDIPIGEHLIRAGDAVICAGDTANRDPDVFDNPDRLDITRSARGHHAFGVGIHQCLGQNLARLELQLAYPAIFKKFPTLYLDRPLQELSFRDHMVVYGVDELPLRW
ncbi:cytochrome P450 (plasmid) [Streptomyces sp. G6]|uniref:cytochrome P450 n=1 Tax=Streptomyces sp. G6 TaxID=1178736 RepID=UPI003ED95C52